MRRDGVLLSRRIHGHRDDAQREMLHYLRSRGILNFPDNDVTWDPYDDALHELTDHP